MKMHLLDIIKDDSIAAIIVEPIMGNVGFIPPRKGYLEFLRK